MGSALEVTDISLVTERTNQEALRGYKHLAPLEQRKEQ
jgi:hypothetical protein